MYKCSCCGKTLWELPLRELREDLCDECFRAWVAAIVTEV